MANGGTQRVFQGRICKISYDPAMEIPEITSEIYDQKRPISLYEAHREGE